MNLREMREHFFYLYGPRSRFFLPGAGERVGFLNLAIGDLQDAIRKEYGLEIIGVALARIVARIFCIAEHFWSSPLVEAMIQKYPASHCSYCQSFPCKCVEKRPAAVLEPISEIQLNWTLKQWQGHFAALYGERNRKRGIENLLNRLFKEITELSSFLMMIPLRRATIDELEREIALELADAIAWTIAIANFFGIDLEKAVLTRYGKHCWKCYRIPCVCGNFSVQPVNWKDYVV